MVVPAGRKMMGCRKWEEPDSQGFQTTFLIELLEFCGIRGSRVSGPQGSTPTSEYLCFCFWKLCFWSSFCICWVRLDEFLQVSTVTRWTPSLRYRKLSVLLESSFLSPSSKSTLKSNQSSDFFHYGLPICGLIQHVLTSVDLNFLCLWELFMSFV